MLQFIFGVFLGSFSTFLLFLIIGINKMDEDRMTKESPCQKKKNSEKDGEK